MERAIPLAEKMEHKALNVLAKKMRWTDEDLEDRKGEVDAKFDHWIPQSLSYSMIMLMHTIVEAQLIRTANRLGEINNKALRVNDIAGSPIERCRTYLEKVIGLNIKTDPAWVTLHDLAELRHIVVHRAGLVQEKEDRKKMKRLSSKYNNQLTINADQLCFPTSLCRHFLDKTEEFFHRLFKKAGLPDKVQFEQ